jgi:hypothetical protein
MLALTVFFVGLGLVLLLVQPWLGAMLLVAGAATGIAAARGS